jgi:hypothetical protein
MHTELYEERWILVKRIYLISVLCAILLQACQFGSNTTDALPTTIPSVGALATSQAMTENAPPPGYRESVSFPMIDGGLNFLSNWRYEVLLQFDGVFSGTPRPVQASTMASVWFNQLSSARRVVIEGGGELFGQEEGVIVEAVRLGTDAYLLRDNVCLGDAGGNAEVAADLGAGDLIGGVTQAIPDGVKAVINGEQVWRYAFTVNDLNLPQIQTGDSGRITGMTGEMWMAPERDAVIRFYLNLDVENAIIFQSALPVTGQIIIRYDLYDIGVDPNITQPFGC